MPSPSAQGWFWRGDSRHGHAKEAPERGASFTRLPLGDWLELQRLGLEELLEAELAELATMAGLLVAAERRQRVEAATVDLNLTRADLAGDLLGPLRIA